MLDQYFKFAKHEAPDKYRIKTLDEFARMTGTFMRYTVPIELEPLWTKYNTTKILDPALQIVKSAEGTEIGVIYQDKLFFIDNVDANRPIFDWSSVSMQY
jgi:hypothetical protein